MLDLWRTRQLRNLGLGILLAVVTLAGVYDLHGG